VADPEKPRPAAPQKTPGPVRPIGARPQGPVAPKIYKPSSPAPKPPQAAVAAALETDGMKAHRREIERRRRQASAERLVVEEEATEGWTRVRRTILIIAALLFAWLVYYKLQLEYHDRWPLWTVWLFMGLALTLSLGWLTWYMNKD
jgi:hypothetical protein